MKHSTLLLSFIFIYLFSSYTSSAQQIKFHSSSSIKQYELSSIQKIIFDSTLTILNIVDTEGVVISKPIDDIKKITFGNTILSIEQPEIANSSPLSLKAYPVPATEYITIEYPLDATNDVEINIYNIDGRLIKSVKQKNQEKGTNTYIWDLKNNTGEDITSGTYICQLISNRTILTTKILLIK